jgi:hypothetical protein
MRIALAAAVLSLFACRGEPPPRDYQNNPPGMTHPVTKKSQTPSQNGMPAAAPEPNYGVEGTSKPSDPKLKDQPPITDTQHATQTTGTAVTGTHLSSKP